VSRSKLPNFFIAAVVAGLAAAGGVAYWQRKATGWTIAGAAGFAIAIALVSGGIIVVMLKLVGR
jgi:hypothetical protein